MRPFIRGSLVFFLSLLALALSVHASEISAGPFVFQTDLNESEARALLSMLTFQPDASVENRWNISSQTLLLSDDDGNLQPSVWLFSTCTSYSNCATSSDIYRSSEGRALRMGRLQQKNGALVFTPPANGAESPPPSFVNESNTPLASINPSFDIPNEWLWAAALLIVLLVTGTFLLRNRD